MTDRFNLCDDFLDRNLREGRAAKVAVRCGAETRTFEQASTRAKLVAAALRRAGVRPEDRVLIVLPDGIEFVEIWFGVLRAGAVFAMVNPLLKKDEYAAYLEYTKARVVVTHEDVIPEIGPALAAARFCETALVVGTNAHGCTPYEEALAREDPDSKLAALEPTGPDDLAGWLFTSGSTGMPKACVHAHSDFAFSAENYALQVAGY